MIERRKTLVRWVWLGLCPLVGQAGCEPSPQGHGPLAYMQRSDVQVILIRLPRRMAALKSLAAADGADAYSLGPLASSVEADLRVLRSARARELLNDEELALARRLCRQAEALLKRIDEQCGIHRDDGAGKT